MIVLHKVVIIKISKL